MKQSFCTLWWTRCDFCYAQGAHDFSLAANIAVSAIIGQKIGGESVWLTIAVSLLVGSFVGAFNGILYAVTGLSDFILTLSVNFLISGALISILGNVAYAEAASGFSTFNNIGFEILVVVVTTLIVSYGFKYTKYGRHCKALSAGDEAVRQSGVNIRLVKFTAFIAARLHCSAL